MKKFLLFLLTGLTLVLTSSASASPYVDLYTPNANFDDTSVTFNANGVTSHTWNFDLIDNILSEGDIDVNDLITSAYLGWTVSGDSKDNANFYEYIDISVNGVLLYDDWEMNNGLQENINILDLISASSTFAVTFNDFNISHKNPKKCWDIIVSDVNISGGYTDMSDAPANHAPEPATMMFFCLGLLGLAGISRKKMQK